MPQIIFTEDFQKDAQHCQNFLEERNFIAAKKFADELEKALDRIKRHPYVGIPLGKANPKRRLNVPYGSSGYYLYYIFAEDLDVIFALGLNHYRENDGV